MSLTTTETITATSGLRNSGGVVNIPGPVVIKNIYAIALSGSQATSSGIRLQVNTGVSGVFSGTGTTLLYFQDLTGVTQSGASTQTYVPPGVFGVEHLALSGVVTVNSGTHLYDLLVTYKAPA